jgi:hypothetical protein
MGRYCLLGQIGPVQSSASVPVEPYDTKTAMTGLFLEESQFDQMLDALKENKNVVLQGAFGGPYRLWNEPCRDNAAQVLILLMAEGKGTLAR